MSKESFSISGLYREHTMSQLDSVFTMSENIISNLDEYALNELLGGYSWDIDKMLLDIVQECSLVINTKQSIQTASFNYLTNVTNQLDSCLKDMSFAYFVSNVLYEFEVAPYHLEWFNLCQIYKKLCIEAARGHSKSYVFSFAYPIWKMWRYAGGKFGREILMITAEHSLAKHFLEMIREAVEDNPFLKEKLYPGPKALNWGKERIVAKNGSALDVKGSGSALRGFHVDTLIIDDLLTEFDMYNGDIRKQSIEFFHSVIMNILNPGGSICVVGCVTGDTLVLNKSKGFCSILDLAPKGIDLKNKGIYDANDLILDSYGNFETSIKYFVNGKVSTKKIILDGELEIEGSLIHPVWRFNENGNEDWCKLPNLKVGDIIEIKDDKEIDDWGSEQKIEVPISDYCDQINLPEYVNEDIAYFLGMYVAEGNLHSNGRQVQITNFEIDLSFMKKYGIDFVSYEKGKYLCSRKNFRNWLVSLFGEDCKAAFKFIPEIICKGTKKNMTAFLQGLFDGDGSTYQNNTISYSTVSKKLAYQLKNVLLMGYGIDCSLSEIDKDTINKNNKKVGLNIRANYNAFTFNFSYYNSKLFFDRVNFRFDRKRRDSEVLNKYTFESEKLPTPVNLLKSIKEIGYKKRIKTLIPEQILKRGGYLTRERLIGIYNYYSSYFQCDELTNLNNYVKKRWKKVKYIVDGEQYTYDFVIPKHNIFIGNGIKNHQTPMHEVDLYGNLKRSKGWRVFEYPAISPEGIVLYPERFGLQELLEKKESQGSIVFSREILVRPVSSATSIFPIEVLKHSLDSNFSMVYNRYSIPFKIKKIGLGVDLAISANVAADYFVCTTVALDENNRYWVLNIFREKGLSYNKQLEVVKRLQNNFQYDTIVVETNGYQESFLQMLQDAGLTNVVGRKTTAQNKYSSSVGLIGLSALFEQLRVKIPNNSDSPQTVNMAAILINELNSMTFANNKIEGAGAHDDTVLSLLFALVAINYVNADLILSFLDK